jgi:ubiquitin carboxyl-terminal hydrolase 8
MSKYTKIHEERKKYINGTSGISGLKNLGNSCYLNSILQCLSHIDLFRTWLIEDGYKGRLDNNLPTLKHDSIVLKLAELFKNLWFYNAEISPRSIKTTMGKISDTFNNNEQQDSHEFLNVLLDTIHDEVAGKVTMTFLNVPEDVSKLMEFMDFYTGTVHTPNEKLYLETNLNKYKEENPDVVTIYNAYKYWEGYVVRSHSMITNLFTGLYYSSVICDECHTITDTFEPFTIVSLPIKEKGITTLEESLREFTKEEILTGDNKFYCSKCKHNVDAHKKMYIWEPPRVLIIQLKRFKNTTRNITDNFSINSTSKISTQVVFPFENLDLAPQLSELHQVANTKYDLYATSNHNSRICNMGHYVAYCKKSMNNSWYKYDDDDVYYIPNDEVKGKVMTEEAYILFYVRQ